MPQDNEIRIVWIRINLNEITDTNLIKWVELPKFKESVLKLSKKAFKGDITIDVGYKQIEK